MISIDTNILARAFLEDDIAQAEHAKDIMRNGINHEGVFISSYVLLEFVWVLKVKKFSRKEIYETIQLLMATSGVFFAQSSFVKEALERYIKGKADFGDYMMYAESLNHGVMHIETFDKKFADELKVQSKKLAVK